MVEFLKIQYRMGKITREQLERLFVFKKITAEEKNVITSGIAESTEETTQ